MYSFLFSGRFHCLTYSFVSNNPSLKSSKEFTASSPYLNAWNVTLLAICTLMMISASLGHGWYKNTVPNQYKYGPR